MSLSMELASKLNEYISRRIKLHDLEAWVVPRLPILIAEPESEVEKLASAVELCLAELSAGLRSERSIRSYLSGLINSNPIVWMPIGAPQPNDTASSATPSSPTGTPQWPDRSLLWNIAPEVVNV